MSRFPARERSCLYGFALFPVLLLALGLVGGIARASTLSFKEVTEAAGVTCTIWPVSDTPGRIMTAGTTVGDFDGDGWPDLFVPSAGNDTEHLFINNHDGTFTDRATEWGLGDLYRGSGAAAGDYDRDGDLDLFVTSFGDLPGEPQIGYHRLYRNDNGSFAEVAAAAGANTSNPETADGFSPVFGDYDLDGDLDLWIGGWLFPFPDYSYYGTRLLQNNGDGTFTDVSVESGVYTTDIRGFSSIFVDLNDDLYPELLVAGDFGTSRYFVNNRDGTFTPQYLPATDIVENGMGTALADFNRDERPDWFVTSIYPGYHYLGPPGNRLYRMLSNGHFKAVKESVGVNDGGWGWGVVAADFDHDGYVDIFHTNGWPGCDIVTGYCFDTDRNVFFRNAGDGRFENLPLFGATHPKQGRAAGRLDYDRDGDLDLFVANFEGRLDLFENELAGEAINWVQIELLGGDNPMVAPNGRGTRVRVVDDLGETHVSWLTGHANYLGGDELMLHFGVGAAERAVSIEIFWADGTVTELNDFMVNQRLVVTAPSDAQAEARVQVR